MVGYGNQGEQRRATSVQTLNFSRPWASRRPYSEQSSDKVLEVNINRHKAYLCPSAEFPVRVCNANGEHFFNAKFVSGGPSRPEQITWDVHENGKSSGFVYLARVLFAVRISGANHIGRDAFLVVLRLPAVVVAHDRHVHLVQHLRRRTALFLRAPARDDALVTGETFTCKRPKACLNL